MLFHVTMTHTHEDCPGYNPEKMPEMLAAFERHDKIAEELNVKVHFIVDGAPEHVAYALLEAESLSSVIGYVTSFPYRQSFKVTAVQHLRDLVEFAKAMVEQK